MKRTLLFLIAFVALLFPARLSAFSYTYEGKTLNYEVLNEEDKTCEVSRNLSFSGDLIIPEIAIDGDTEYTVTSIGEYAFSQCKGLTSVVIPNSVIAIHRESFTDCRGLTSLVIGNAVEFISVYAFSDCTSLTSVVIPNSVTKIYSYAFRGCTGLTSLVIGNAVSSISYDTFRDCHKLTSVVIPNSVTEISSGAFSGCDGLIKSAYPNTLENPFKSGTTITYDPEGAIVEDGWVWGPEKSAVYFAPLNLEGEYTIPESVTSIGNYAFRYCDGLTSVVIGNSVTSIGDYAFCNCDALASAVIGNSVTSIGDYAFYDCDALASVEIGDSVSSIDNPVTSIGDYAFYDCDGLTSVVIGNSVSSIGNNAFRYCGALASAVIGNSVTSIGDDAFYDCEGLTSVVIPKSVTSIGNHAFYMCKGLKSAVIGNSVTTIGKSSFYGCDGLIKSAYPNTLENPFKRGISIAYNPEGDIVEDGWVWGPEKSAIYFAPLYLEGEYTIPESVTSIGDYAFSQCDGLTSVMFGDSVTSIGNHAFYNCSGLTNVTSIKASPAVMKDDAFEGLYKKAYLTVPDGAVNDYLTTNWSLFKNIRLKESETELKTYSDGVFEYRINPPNMTAMITGAKSYSNLQIPQRFTDDSDSENPVRYYIKGIGYNAFGGKRVNSVEFNSRSEIEYIGDYAFEGSSFSSITLPETVKSIGTNAFKNNAYLQSITIPENVIEIKDFTFYNCTGLTDVTLNNSLIAIGESAFSMDKEMYNSDKRYGSLTIPASLKEIGENTFLYRDLDKVIISDLRAWCDIDFHNNDSNPCGWALEGFWLGDNEIVDLVVPGGVEEIKPFSFVTAAKLKSVTLPSSVRSIGEEAFYGNYYLESISLSENLESIGKRAFCKNYELNSITLPETLKRIEDEAFYQCRKLSSVSIPSSVEYIGHESFIAWQYVNGKTFQKYLTSLCLEDGLTPIEIEADAFAIPTEYTNDKVIRYNTPDTLYLGRPLAMNRIPDGFSTTLTNLTVGNLLTEVPASMFKGCGLRSLVLGNSIQSIGDEAFRSCNLEEVIVPPYVETIGASAFQYNNLSSIIMGHSVKSIGDKAFDGCPAKTVSITAQTPPTAPNNTFSNYSGKLYVQGEKAKDAYYDAFTCWDRFDGYVMIEAEEIKIYGADNISGNAGDTFQLTASIWPENVTLPQIFWRSTNPEIATVDANGLVTLQVDLDSLKTRAQGEGDIAGTCTIIAETLYNDGPVAQVAVDESVAIPATAINLSETEMKLTVGENGVLTATVAPEDATDKTVTWSSSDEAVATVDANGNVTAVAVGEAVITASCGEVSASCKVTVLPILVESLTIDPTEWTGEEGSEFRITATVLPENATDPSVIYESSDEDVATVDAEGLVKVLKAGTCIITVSTTDGSNLTAECVITGTDGVEEIFSEDAAVDVYDMNGALLKRGCAREDLKQLTPAVYILRSGNRTVKTVIR